jgi:hypothetical protein
MTTPPSAESAGVPLGREWLQAARYYLGKRWILVALATFVVVAGLALNWSWLVATGIAPILLTALPCLVMCGAGLCMNRLFGNSCESQPSQAQKSSESAARPVVATTAELKPSEPREENQVEPVEQRRTTDA